MKIGPVKLKTYTKPKGKAKSGKSKAERKIEETNIFKVYLDPHEEAKDDGFLATFKQYIDYLSLAELNNLHRKIARVRNKSLHTKTIESCRFAHEEIDQRILYSEDALANLTALVRDRIKPLNINGYKKTTTGILKQIDLNGTWLTAERFIKTYLSEEYTLADQLIADGILLLPNRLHGPLSVLKRILKSVIL